MRARDLGDRAVDVAEDRRHDEAGASLRALGAQLGGPAVVRARAREHELGIGGAVDGEAGAERRAHLAGDRVGTGEHDLAGHAVGRQLLVALLGVPPAAQTDLVEAVAVLVLAEPLLLELLAPGEHVVVGAEALAPHLLHQRVARAELVVEAVAVLRVEVLAVHRRVGPGVAVGRDDEIAVRHARLPLEHRG